jgi:predicted ATPase
MLTRLEVDGFKNLKGFVVEFGPFTCIAGPNGVGKSNVFDAIHFLSLLANHPIMDAAQQIRAARGRSGDPRELLWTDGSTRASEVRLAAEMIVSKHVTDDFGREAEATSTFLRYELRLAYEPPASGPGKLGQLILRHESLDYIKKTSGTTKIPWASLPFRDATIMNTRRGSGFISTEQDGDQEVIKIHQDGGSRGQPRPAPARTAPRTVVCTTTTASDPTILAARREMQSWRLFALEPSAMRSPDPFTAKPELASDGSNMAATLYRLATRPQQGGDASPDTDACATIATRLASLIDARRLRVDRDDRRDLLTLELQQGFGGFLPARSLSEGTLRFLALSILDYDPSFGGLVCMEEPENGIHPERIPAMVDLVRGIAVDPEGAPGPDNTLRQVIVNTHSPLFVKLQNDTDRLFAREVKIRDDDGNLASALRLLPQRGTWRDPEGRDGVGLGDMISYLTDPPGTQVSLLES